MSLSDAENERVCHGSCSEQHAPRQPLSSLILASGKIQNMKKHTLIILSLIMLAGCSRTPKCKICNQKVESSVAHEGRTLYICPKGHMFYEE